MLEDIRRLAVPIDDGIDTLLEAIGDARFVLLGEASHGTSDYYTYRAEITKRLITERGFDFVAVEGDWPDCFWINLWVKGRADARRNAHEVLGDFERWPTWMWANEEVASFLEWLRLHNASSGNRVGFYGLDVYSLWDSLYVVFEYLREHHPGHLDTARSAVRCFEPYAEDPQRYAWATRMLPDACVDEVVSLLADVRGRAGTLDGEPEAELDAVQNAEVVAGAERYYRALVGSDDQSWNVRDIHMTDTLDRLVAHDSPDAKAVVWEHNTHIGDARATPMRGAGLVNVGQLVRERHARDGVFLCGFGGHRGAVIASDAWGSDATRFPVPSAQAGTHEALLHEGLGVPSVLVFGRDRSGPWLSSTRGHRAIGVVYDPGAERYGNWVPTIMGKRYDAFVYFDQTSALHPLHGEPIAYRAEKETYPWAV